jgi:hypothetical protein
VIGKMVYLNDIGVLKSGLHGSGMDKELSRNSQQIYLNATTAISPRT